MYVFLAHIAPTHQVEASKHPLLWFHKRNLRGIVDRLDRPGVVAINGNRALVIGADGSIERSIDLKDAGTPISYDVENGSPQLLTHEVRSLPEYATSIRWSYPQADGQGHATILSAIGLAVFLRGSVWTYPEVTGWHCLAVNDRNGDVFLADGSRDPAEIHTYRAQVRDSIYSWNEPPETFSLNTDPGYTFTTMSGYDDARFIDDRTVVMLAEPRGVTDHPDWRRELESKLALKDPPLELWAFKRSPAATTRYLIAVDLEERTTRPILRVTRSGMAEGASFNLGKMSLSKDRKWIYLQTGLGIARIPLTGLSKLQGEG